MSAGPLNRLKLLSPRIGLLALALVFAASESRAESSSASGLDRAHLFFQIGPDWRTTRHEQRDTIPKTIGGSIGLGFYLPLGSTFFVGTVSEIAITSQISGKRNGTIGDWSGTEVFPITPILGFRLGNLYVSGGYPQFAWMTLLAKASNGATVKYEDGQFFQLGLGWETASGRFGFQYRWGKFAEESVGTQTAVLNPEMQVSDFALLFAFPFF